MTPAQQMQRALDAFLNYRKATAKPATYRHDRFALRPLREYLALNPPATTPRELMIGYLAYIRNTAALDKPRYPGVLPSPATIAIWAQRAFQMCKWAVEEGYLDALPLKSKELPKQPPPKPDPLTPEEVSRVLRLMDDATHRVEWINRRDRATIITLLETGCRIGELVQIRVGDVSQGYADVIQKGGRPHRLLFTVPCLDAMRAYLDVCPFPLTADDALWQSKHARPLTPAMLRLLLLRIGQRAGVHLYPHRLRDTSATLRLAAGAPTEVVRRALGHSTEQMIRHYVRLNDLQQRRLLEATSPTARLLQESTQKEVP